VSTPIALAAGRGCDPLEPAPIRAGRLSTASASGHAALSPYRGAIRDGQRKVGRALRVAVRVLAGMDQWNRSALSRLRHSREWLRPRPLRRLPQGDARGFLVQGPGAAAPRAEPGARPRRRTACTRMFSNRSGTHSGCSRYGRKC